MITTPAPRPSQRPDPDDVALGLVVEVTQAADSPFVGNQVDAVRVEGIGLLGFPVGASRQQAEQGREDQGASPLCFSLLFFVVYRG